MSAISRRREASPVFDAQAMRLAEAFWPGPAHAGVAKTPTARWPISPPRARHGFAIRVPAHPIARDILRAFGGRWRPRRQIYPAMSLRPRQSMCKADLEGRIDLIVDSGAVEVGVESTIIGCFEVPMLLRPGGVRAPRSSACWRALSAAAEDADRDSGQPLAPGMPGLALRARTGCGLRPKRVEPAKRYSHSAWQNSGVDSALQC